MKRFMTTKMTMSVLVIAVVTAMMGMGTYALFTSTAQSGANVFESGTVQIIPENGLLQWGASINDMNPGDDPIVLSFPATYSGMDATLSSTLTESNPNDCLDITPVLASGPVVDGGDASSTVTVAWGTPLDDNACQGNNNSLSLTVTATQAP